MPGPTDLADRLTPSHLNLPDKEEDLRREIKEAAVPTKPPEGPPADDPRHQKEYTFELKHTDDRGKLWRGQFTSKILNLAERQEVGALRAKFQAGMPLESFDQFTADINMQVSHMMFSLKQRPKWAEQLRELEDPGIVAAIWEEVAAHEAFFLGWLKAPVSSSAKPGDGAGNG